MTDLVTLLSQKTALNKEHITNILKLLEEGATIPFIARYRKEMTGGASDEILREFESVYESTKKLISRKEDILRLIEEKAILTDAIKASVAQATTLSALEDIYRPYKEKKSSRASVAIAQGLTPLANCLEKGMLSIEAFKEEASRFVKGDILSVDAAIKGAQDILAERYGDAPKEREILRQNMAKHGVLEIKKTKTFKEDGLYKSLVGQSEKVATIPSHRYLALMRGVKEKELSVKISVDIGRIEEAIERYKLPRHGGSSKELLLDAYKDGLKRLLLPSLEREIHGELKERSDIAAIHVFGKNLGQLLMTPPVTKRVILGVDPAYRTGCKLAVIDENGTYVDHGIIYPTPPQNDYEGAKAKVVALWKRYGIQAVAIGNGTGSREAQEFFARLNDEEKLSLAYTVVSEAGASVYSASKIATQEYPDLDVTIRGAISIAQRLRDPMAALVKIDPKSLGIGQYQHDVDQKLLEKKLGDVTEDLVNRVGVDINSASISLLSYVAGIGPKVAHSIVAHRETLGSFTCKEALLKVKGLGQKAYEQAAGFIRIKEGKSPLDNTGVHPESYTVAVKLAGMDLAQVDIVALSETLHVGKETLQDIIKELQKPGFDPRDELPPIPFKQGLTDIGMLSVGSFVSGVVRNIADFGAFVDIGLKNDGMIHLSQMSQKRIAHPLEVLTINQFLEKIEVISIDKERGKIGLSLRNV